ncbi:putative MerR family transcriptional regulator [Gordonia effusa NBRC 100432]|uniref:Putative MerR family transcriptional regulator n=1 Tax=Gordonia effusa NBRC 100432 TaxID=1077974 RepID=H0R4Z8_9ACTN|nr:putative MerR family transcriptional regulator [Gordonia effusa NBRC 100432]
MVVVSETKARTVGDVAKLTGVSVRALHHYDEIGLVAPSGRSASGYRLYADADVERLLQVLTYRELGFPLEQISTLLDDPSADAMTHLRRQHELLQQRIGHLQHMVGAVEKMMNSKKIGVNLTTEEQAEIFGDNWPGDEYAAEAEQRWGDTDAWKQSQQRSANYTKQDWQRLKDESDALLARMANAFRSGVEPGTDEANAIAQAHRASIDAHYDCSYEMQWCLAQMYLADERFTRYYDDQAPGLAQWVHDVVVANARSHGATEAKWS